VGRERGCDVSGESSEQGRLAKGVASLAAARGTGLGLSLCVSYLLASTLGAGVATDAFFLVRRLTRSLSTALDRALLTIYVPPIVRVARQRGRAEVARLLRSHLARILAPGLLCAAALGLFAPWVVKAFGPGFGPERAELAASLLRVLGLLVPVALAAALATGLLNALRWFGRPAFAAELPRVAMILVLLLLIPPLGVEALAWALLGGSALAVLVLVFPVRAALRGVSEPEALERGDSAGDLHAHDGPPVAAEREGLGLQGRALPMGLAQVHNQGSVWIDVAFASTLGVGLVSVLEYSTRLTGLVPGIVSGSLITVTYTELSHRAAESGQGAPVRPHVAGTLRALLFLMLPVLVFLGVGADRIVSILLEHGAFSAKAAAQTASVVRWLGPAIVLSAMINTLVTALFVSASPATSRAIGALAFASLCTRAAVIAVLIPHLGIIAIPVGAGLAMTVGLLVACLFYSAQWGALVTRSDLVGMLGSLVGAAAMAAVMLGLGRLWQGVEGESLMAAFLGLGILGGSGGLAYVGVAATLRLEEFEVIRRAIARRLAPRPRRAAREGVE